MHSEVRELLEAYELNTSHLVMKSGILADGKLTCDTSGIHVGDETPYGRITSLDFEVVCERPITELPLRVKVYDYVTDSFIDKTFEEQVKPIVLRYAPLEATECEEQLQSHYGRVYLSHRDIIDILEVDGGTFDVDKKQGILMGSFPPLVKVRYTYGGKYADVHRACVLLTASFVLGFIGSTTGGGSLNVQGYGRNYGARGKYNDIRQELDRNAYELLQKHVVGMV